MINFNIKLQTVIVLDYSRLEFWSNSIGIDVDVECFFRIERKTERGNARIFGRKEKTRKSIQVYMVDIHL